MTTLVKDLISIPERVHRGDFVLRLTEGVVRPDETLRDYVVTPQLVGCFDNALGFIKTSLDSRSSKAAYLHGSFGSGKSHFMAVLHLLLQNEPQARSIPELAPVVARHNAWTEGKRFLLVPYHMIGARSMESAILGHYADHVRKLHPEAPVPGVYLAEEIFRDARSLRETMGDESFFAKLSSGSGGGGDWGDLGEGWNAESFEEAMRSPARSEARIRLVGDLVEQFFRSVQRAAESHDEAFVTLDDGLSIISKHAQSLGYDAVILFLDELILWLASHAADVAFVNREGQKLAKLVESQSSDRPIPIVSFVARQRDLRELVGEHVTGSEQLTFGDVLKWWEARFHTIVLEDRNLPTITEKRILKPRSEAARIEMDGAFEETVRIREEVMNVLLTGTADRQMFRKVYPFSPALVQTLVAVSSVLQRERTALKVMLQLLVNQREGLKLGDIVPVGDLFDVIAEGDEPFTEGMRIHFENAKRLYHRKLLPMLEKEHGVSFEQDIRGGSFPEGDAKAVAFRADDRLLKTLLLSALVPEVESLKALTPARLAALNHGTIRSPIPGRESQMVLSRFRNWAAQVGEIKIGEESANPLISLQLTGVDTESIIESARGQDNFGNRRRVIRDLVFQEMGIEESDQLFVAHEITWRGTRRSFDVLFANVRELSEDQLRAAAGSGWKVIIDFPFDQEPHTPRDDLAKVEQFQRGGVSSNTLLWLPSFFSRETQKDLGTLVILDHVLKGERFASYATHLAPADRATAKTLLDNQRTQLRQRMLNCLEGAYGLATPPPGSLDSSLGLSEHFQALDPTFTPQPPVGASLKEGLEHLLDQVLSHQFPAHPVFEADVRLPNLRKVYGEMQPATQSQDGRISVEKTLRALLRQIAVPAWLGEMGETHFVLGHHWRNHFLRKQAEEGATMTVGKLRDWMEDPKSMGLPKEVQNLVILVFADQTGRAFFQYGGPAQATLDNLPEDLELREPVLPSQEDWDLAVTRAAAILGIAVSPLRNAGNAAKLAEEAKRIVGGLRPSCQRLVGRLRDVTRQFPPCGEPTSRQLTAQAVLTLVEALAAAAPGEIARTLATGAVATSEAAMGVSLKRAEPLCATLETANWEIFEALAGISDERAAAAASVRARVREALGWDEHAVALAPALHSAQGDALKLLTRATPPPPEPPPVEPPPPQPPPAPGRTVVEQASRRELAASEARDALRGLEDKLGSDPALRLSIEWVLYREEGDP
ncbi:MAG: phage resistance protein [Deltaproteobacteria bacterium]|nr:phage resistance protein [Deltaproteobacteria bacterium]